ncbi:MAG TPA: VOC family protein [Bryobacteraceae bacterium]|jgi:catechol 2,3-dioxygenase-like lactoylglutathione lyase family enzyme
MKSTTIAASLVFLATGLHAQLAPFSDTGVVMGHLHINTADVAAQKKFWVELFAARPVKLGTTEGVAIPGALILFKAAAPSGPTEGSTVNHVGVLVPSIAEFPAKFDARGIKYVKNPNGRQLMVDALDGLKLELTADPSISGPVRFHHIHFYTADPLAIQAWYAEKFGAKPGKRAQWEAGDLPGANLTYAKATDSVPTANRALDHIGFEVRDLEAFCKKLEAAGVKFDTPYRKMPQINLALAFLTDPWGTRIELTEGLGKL